MVTIICFPTAFIVSAVYRVVIVKQSVQAKVIPQHNCGLVIMLNNFMLPKVETNGKKNEKGVATVTIMLVQNDMCVHVYLCMCMHVIVVMCACVYARVCVCVCVSVCVSV